MIVQKTSVFPASRETVFQKLQRLETLQYIAKPYATFERLEDGVCLAVGECILRAQAEKVDQAAEGVRLL